VEQRHGVTDERIVAAAAAAGVGDGAVLTGAVAVGNRFDKQQTRKRCMEGVAGCTLCGQLVPGWF
jgi:hypothetical protein